jgi:flagellar M-ring protein FliF
VTAFQEFWQRFDRPARIGLVLGVLVIAGATFALGAALLRTDYQVLFADLAPQDAATITAELDKSKTPYRLGGDGNTILVPAEQVLKTRLRLVGKELPLRGAVGFELFNASEVGMTEFTQKVNYQRALQGELTRTILALDEVQSVRVHLVMAEQGLFKKNLKQAKASISLALKPGRALEAGQVQGIQRLVSAAVPDIRPADVTIVDQHGMALTRRSGGDGDEAGAGADGLDEKRALETYLQKKIADVLERTFGANQAIASVDVTLRHEQSKVTTESVLGNTDGAAAGVKVRERVTSHDGGADADPGKPGAGSTSHEADYQVGRRVEQIVSAAGGLARINIAVVVRGAHDQAQLDRVKDVVALAAGINRQRGDGVSVYTLDQMGNPPLPAQRDGQAAAALPDPAANAPVAPARHLADAAPGMLTAALLATLALAVGAGALLWRQGRRRAAPPLSIAQRRAVLAQVNDWLDAPHRAVAEEH